MISALWWSSSFSLRLYCRSSFTVSGALGLHSVEEASLLARRIDAESTLHDAVTFGRFLHAILCRRIQWPLALYVIVIFCCSAANALSAGEMMQITLYVWFLLLASIIDTLPPNSFDTACFVVSCSVLRP